jgi:hypothetical protein
MLPSNTVFVVGAGASSECGLPVGTKLKTRIADALRFTSTHNHIGAGEGDEAIYNALQRGFHSQRFATLIDAALHISDGLSLSPSIDDFIDAQGDDSIRVVGKLAIARTILQAEHDSDLYLAPGAAWHP